MTRKAIITGGAGFIGSHLAQHLKAAGRSLVLVDDLSTGRRSNIEPLLDDDCVLIEGRAGEVLAASHLWAGVDEVYHLAATVGVRKVLDDPAGMIANNINETEVVLRAAAEAGAAVLLASSSEVYGRCPTIPLCEDMELVYGPTTAPRWSYALTKAIDEHLALNRHRQAGLRVVITRLFNTIGPRQRGRHGMVVPRFVSSAVRNKPIEVYGDGRQTRTFCDVRDVTRAMVSLLSEPACSGAVYNLGSTRQIAIGDLADLVIELTGSTAGKHFVPYADAYGPDFEDPPQRQPDVSRIEGAIGFHPRISLRETLEELVGLERMRQAAAAPSAANGA